MRSLPGVRGLPVIRPYSRRVTSETAAPVDASDAGAAGTELAASLQSALEQRLSRATDSALPVITRTAAPVAAELSPSAVLKRRELKSTASEPLCTAAA